MIDAGRLGALLVFVAVVALVVVVGIVVGMIVAGRIDRLTTPRPARPDEDGDAARAGALHGAPDAAETPQEDTP